MQIYILVKEDIHLEFDELDVQVFSTLKEAQNEMERQANLFKKYFNEEDGYLESFGATYHNLYIDGDYNNNRVSFNIFEKEI